MTWWNERALLSDGDRQLIERARQLGAVDSMPTAAVAEMRQRTLSLIEQTLDPGIVYGCRYSPLGPEWSSDIDIHVREMPDPADLQTLGWHDLSGLLENLGRDGVGRWAVTENGAVIGSADFETNQLPDPLLGVLRRNRSTPSLRSVLELRLLQRTGAPVPTDGSLQGAIDLERRLGGDELPPQQDPILVERASSAARKLRSVVPRLPRNGTRISISGVDGAGKSTVIEQFTAELALAGVPFTQIWARPGYDLGAVDVVAKFGKRLLGKQPEPGIRAVVSDSASAPASRQGRTAIVWRTFLVGEYLAKMRRRTLSADGLVVFDRYAVDAEVTLAFAYGLDRPWVGRILRRMMPEPDVQIFLMIDAETAIERKPEDPMGRVAIVDQLERYRTTLATYPGVHEIDATTPVEMITAELWSLLTMPIEAARN
jgi:thymidylate kinase